MGVGGRWRTGDRRRRGEVMGTPPRPRVTGGAAGSAGGVADGGGAGGGGQV
jgi:hypothetical protein